MLPSQIGLGLVLNLVAMAERKVDPLDAIRALMANYSPVIDALVVPSEDYHQVGYTAVSCFLGLFFLPAFNSVLCPSVGFCICDVWLWLFPDLPAVLSYDFEFWWTDLTSVSALVVVLTCSTCFYHFLS